jgi:hypothetical protein
MLSPPDNMDITFAVPSERVNKEYVFELVFHKKRKVFPLLMRRTRSYHQQKCIFMLESLTDIFTLKQELDNFLKTALAQKTHLSPEESTFGDSLLLNPENHKGTLLIMMDNFLQSKLSVTIRGNKVTIDDSPNLSALKDALNTFITKNRKMTDLEYESMIALWADDEDYCMNDSLDDPLTSNLDIFGSMNLNHGAGESEGLCSKQTDELKRDLDFRDREIDRIRLEYKNFVRVGEESSEKNEQLYQQYLEDKNSSVDEVFQKIASVKSMFEVFMGSVGQIEREISKIRNQSFQFQRNNDLCPRFGENSPLGSEKMDLVEKPESPQDKTPKPEKIPEKKSQQIALQSLRENSDEVRKRESICIDFFTKNLKYQEIQTQIKL